MSIYYLLYDTNRIKDYVFSTTKLKEIYNASFSLLDLEEDIKKKFEKNVIYIGGGGGLFKFDIKNESEITKIENYIKVKFYEYTRIASCTMVWQKDLGDFRETQKNLRKKLILAKNNRREFVHYPSEPLMKLCESCGKFPATIFDKDDGKFLCDVCNHKRRYDFKNQAKFFNEVLGLNIKDIPLTEEEMLEPNENMVGFIYGDGNNMGSYFENINSEEEYRNFSKKVTNIFSENIRKSIKEFSSLNSHKKYNFKVLMLGGDDFIIYSNAKIALKMALSIAKNIEKDSRNNQQGSKFTVSIGVAIARKSIPIYNKLTLAEGLLNNAKRKSYEIMIKQGNEKSVINFYYMSSSFAENFDKIYKKKYMKNLSEKILHLTMRPYTIEDMEKLLEIVEKIKNQNIPVAKLIKILDGELLGYNMGIYNSIWVYNHLKEKQKEVLLEFYKNFELIEKPWKKRTDESHNIEYYSNILDVIELLKI